jgi:hypothetical protein
VAPKYVSRTERKDASIFSKPIARREGTFSKHVP